MDYSNEIIQCATELRETLNDFYEKTEMNYECTQLFFKCEDLISEIQKYTIQYKKEKGENKMYALRNHVTGEVKCFEDFHEMREWWKKLSLDKSLEWGDWLYVQGN